ncbi:hypothetical protein ACFVFS_17575 [Kitasatospora sp. NPDC057692]|uniref:hypothetical protein n=1 Tax=Kitasatospora sp. NPDC057692 TaxID=3346215 RepID=UPI0036C901D6
MNLFFLTASAVLAVLLVVGEVRSRRRVRSVRAEELPAGQVLALRLPRQRDGADR